MTMQEVLDFCKEYEERTGKRISYGKARGMMFLANGKSATYKPRTADDRKVQKTTCYKSRKPSTKITEAMIDEFERMYNKGFLLNEIAVRFDVSFPTVKRKLIERGVYKPVSRIFWTTERNRELKEMHSSGIPYNQIAEHFSVTLSAVYGQASKLKLTQKKNR